MPDPIDDRLKAATDLLRTADLPDARDALLSIASDCAAAGDKAREALARHRAGTCSIEMGDFPAARKELRAALDLRKELKDRKGVALTLHQIGFLAMSEGKFADARGLYSVVISLAGETGDKAAMAGAIQQMASCFMEEGQNAPALEGLRHAYRLYRGLGDASGTARTLWNIGMLAGRMEKGRAALRVLAAAALLEKALGLPGADEDWDEVKETAKAIGLGQKEFEEDVETAKAAFEGTGVDRLVEALG